MAAGEVTLLAAGPCTLAAAQPGYLEAQQSFAVERTLQQVGFSSAVPADAVEGGPAYQPAASASSGLPVAFVSLTPAVCAIQGDEVAPLAAGLCTIAAEQAGDAEYEPALAGDPVLRRGGRRARDRHAGGWGAGGGRPGGGSAVAARKRDPVHGSSDAAPARDSVGRRGATGRSPFSLTVSPGGTLRWQMTFTRTTRCPPHTPSCARRARALRRGSEPAAAGTFSSRSTRAAAALKLLRDRRTLHVQALVTLTTASGTVARVRATVLVRLGSSR